MIVDFQRKHWIVFAVSLFLLAACSLFFYYMTVQPLQSEKKLLQAEVDNLENRIGSQQREIVSSAGENVSDLYLLTQKLPLQPYIDNYLGILDRAATISGSYILSANRLEDEERPIIEENVEDAEENEEEEDAASNIVEEEEEENGEEPPIDQQTREVEAASALSYHVRIQASGYDNLLHFLEQIDTNLRFMNIDTLTFEGKAERVWEADEQNFLTFSLVITSFYYPETEDLADQKPSSNFDTQPEKITRFYKKTITDNLFKNETTEVSFFFSFIVLR